MISRYYIIVLPLIVWHSLLEAQNKGRMRLTIDEIFQLADKNSHSLKESFLGTVYSKEAINVAKSQRLPTLETSVNGSFIGDQSLLSRDLSESQSISTPHWGNNLSLDLSLPLYAGKNISNNIKLRQLQALLAEVAYENNKQEIRFLLSDWYLYLYRLNNEGIIYESNKKQSEELLSIMKERYMQGVALKSDVTRYELRLKDIEMDLEQTINQKSIINYQLVKVLGLPDETEIEPNMSLEASSSDLINEENWQEIICNQSNDIKAAKINVEIADKQKDLIKSERLPSVFLWGTESFKGPIITALPPVDSNLNVWQLGVGIKFDISSLYRTQKKIKMQDYFVKQSEQRLQKTIDNEKIETHTTLIQLKQAANQFEIRKKYKELADENYEVVSNRYLNGLAIVTEMLDASNEQLSSKLKLINKQTEIYYYYYKLKKIAGVL